MDTEPSTKNHLTDSESNQHWFESLPHGGGGVKFNRYATHKLLPQPKITIYRPLVYGKNNRKISNLVPSTDSNRLRTRKAECRSRTDYAPKNFSCETAVPAAGRISTTIALILSRPSIMLIDILLTSAGVGSTFKTLLFAYLFEFALAFYHLDSDFFPFIRLVTAILIVIIIFCHCRSAKLILRHFEIMF